MVKKITKSKVVSLYLSNYSKKYYLRELASILKKPHQTIKPYVESLVKEKILVKEERKNITEYSLNFKDKRVVDSLMIAEKEKLGKRLEEDTLLNILFEKLSDFFDKNTFVVFGSAAGKVEEGSDIDLLVIGRQKAASVIKDFEEVYNKKVHRVQVTDFNQLTLTLINEIYKKHLIFNNTEQIIRFFWGLHEKNKLV